MPWLNGTRVGEDELDLVNGKVAQRLGIDLGPRLDSHKRLDS